MFWPIIGAFLRNKLPGDRYNRRGAFFCKISFVVIVKIRNLTVDVFNVINRGRSKGLVMAYIWNCEKIQIWWPPDQMLTDVNILSQSTASMMILSGIMNLVVKLVSMYKTSCCNKYFSVTNPWKANNNKTLGKWNYNATKQCSMKQYNKAMQCNKEKNIQKSNKQGRNR